MICYICQDKQASISIQMQVDLYAPADKAIVTYFECTNCWNLKSPTANKIISK